MKYLLHLAYKGTKYRGWQRQPHVKSVQQTIEDSIIKVIKEKIHIVGCGRTDAGVHSSNYVAHIEVSKAFQNDFLFIINKVLPDDIIIYSIERVADSSQAQFHVSYRRYDYFLHLSPDALLTNLSTYYDENAILNITEMQKCLALLEGKKDFKGFCKQPHLYDHTICDIKQVMLIKKKDRIQIRIVGNRFLRSMVRLIVGNLLLVGRGETSFTKWKDVLEGNSTFEHFNQAFPQGLYLSGVYYRDRHFDKPCFLDII